MEIVNIYGHIADESEIVISVGNYNNIHGLACYFPKRDNLILQQRQYEDLLQINPITEVIAPSVIQLILKYETPPNNSDPGKVYFSLTLKDFSNNSLSDKKYINVDIKIEDNKKIATANVSNEKAIFSIDYSNIDRKPRSKLLAGALYSLETIHNNETYIVSWKIQGFSNGDLIIFLPTTWYENTNSSTCQVNNGIINLIERLNQLQFKGYTTPLWCEDFPQVINCTDNNMCGECLGQCSNNYYICYPTNNDTSNKKLICGDPSKEPNMFENISVSQSNESSQNTFDTIIAIIIIFILIGLLVFALVK